LTPSDRQTSLGGLREDARMSALFRHYDRAGLDAAYDNARKIPVDTLAQYRRRWAEQSAHARKSIPCDLDIPYGSGSGERLDIFRPKQPGLSPVQIYIHGGYWISNDKADCSYVALGFVAAGFCTVVVNYGLVPTIDMREQVRQARNAVTWVAANIEKYGGDPGRIYVTGHSAGGHLAVMLLAASEPVAAGLAGVTSLSGLYDLEPVRLSFVNEKLSLRPQDVVALSPIHCKPRAASARLLLTIGENEGEEWIRQMNDFADRWRSSMPHVQTRVLPGTDHFSMRAALDDADSSVSRLIREHMGAGKPRQETSTCP